jgi:hypothetical protein
MNACLRSCWRSRWWVRANEWVDMYWINVQILLSFHWGVWRTVLERAKHGGHSTDFVHQQEEGVSWYARKHRLFSLGVEELPFCMARVVLRACWGYVGLWRWESLQRTALRWSSLVAKLAVCQRHFTGGYFSQFWTHAGWVLRESSGQSTWVRGRTPFGTFWFRLSGCGRRHRDDLVPFAWICYLG